MAVESILRPKASNLITGTYGIVFIVIPSVNILALIIMLRIWLLYYDINLSKFLRQKAWLIVIDPESGANNWFKKNESTFGNSIFLVKYGMSIMLIVCVISGILRFVNVSLIERLLSWFVVLSFIIFASIIWYKLRARGFYYDKLGIKKELLIMIACLIFYILIGASLICLLVLKIFDNDDYDVAWRFMAFGLANSSIVLLTLLPKKLCHLEPKHPRLELDSKTNSVDSGSGHPMSTSIQHNHDHDHDLRPRPPRKFSDSSSRSATSGTAARSRPFGHSWTDIVCTQFGYESFMDHVMHEFSLENLLFISEVCCFMFYVLCFVFCTFCLCFLYVLFFFGLCNFSCEPILSGEVLLKPSITLEE